MSTPKKPQVDEQPSNQPTEQPSPLRFQPYFPRKKELLVHHRCHMDAPLADDSRGWRWLRDVTSKYLYRRSLDPLPRKCRQVDPSGIITYPWQGCALTAAQWSNWKYVMIGLQGNAQACIVLSEATLYALFMVWQRTGLEEAIAAKWVTGSTPKARAGGHVHGHGPQMF